MPPTRDRLLSDAMPSMHYDTPSAPDFALPPPRSTASLLGYRDADKRPTRAAYLFRPRLTRDEAYRFRAGADSMIC